MAVRLTKPFVPIDDALAQIKGQLGVFELADTEDRVIYIGYAGGRSLYGLEGEVAECARSFGAAGVRVEVNSAYLSRWRELVMAHVADYGSVPEHNPPMKLGRLSPS